MPVVVKNPVVTWLGVIAPSTTVSSGFAPPDDVPETPLAVLIPMVLVFWFLCGSPHGQLIYCVVVELLAWVNLNETVKAFAVVAAKRI